MSTLVGIRLSLNTDTIFISEFSSREMIRRYAGTADINLSASGSQLISGPSRSQQYVWTISSLLTKAECELIDKMFRDWDQARFINYPSKQAFMAVVSDPDRLKAQSHRENAISDTYTLILRPSINQLKASLES